LKTIALQIGNSDNKLTQVEWANFVIDIANLLEGDPTTQIHFFGGPTTWECWQNVAWIFVTGNPMELCQEVKRIRTKYKQDSAAWTEGSTAFV